VGLVVEVTARDRALRGLGATRCLRSSLGTPCWLEAAKPHVEATSSEDYLDGGA